MRNGPLLTGALVAATALLTMTPAAQTAENSSLSLTGSISSYSYKGDLDDKSEQSKGKFEITSGSVFLGSETIEVQSMVTPVIPLPGQAGMNYMWNTSMPRGTKEASQRVVKFDSKNWDVQVRVEYTEKFSANIDGVFFIAAGGLQFKKPPVENGEGTVIIDELRAKASFKVLGKQFDTYKGNALWKVKGTIKGGPNNGKAFKMKLKMKVKKAPRLFV